MNISQLSHQEIRDLAIPTKAYAETLARWPKSAIDYSDPAKALSTLRKYAELAQEFDEPNSDVAETTVHVPASDGHLLPALVFRPNQGAHNASLPLIVLYHGGGYTFGNPHQLAEIARLIALKHRAVVVCPAYRLAPEHPFPQPHEDIRETFFWIAKNAQKTFQADPKRGLIIGGISAGGSASVYVAHAALDAKLDPPITGVWDAAGAVRIRKGDGDKLDPKYRERMLSRDDPACNNDPVMSSDMTKLMDESLKADRADWRFAPMFWPDGRKALPKMYFQVCGRDPSRDEMLVFEELARLDGVQTKLDLYAGLPHCFWMSLLGTPAAQKWEIDTLTGIAWLLP